MSFHLCEHCRRHVRAEDARCPFCGEARVDSIPARVAPGRVSRAVLVAGATMVATACGSGVVLTPVYGAPAPPYDGGNGDDAALADGGPDADAAAKDAGPDALQGAYGGPPPDAGTLDSGGD